MKNSWLIAVVFVGCQDQAVGTVGGDVSSEDSAECAVAYAATPVAVEDECCAMDPALSRLVPRGGGKKGGGTCVASAAPKWNDDCGSYLNMLAAWINGSITSSNQQCSTVTSVCNKLGNLTFCAIQACGGRTIQTSIDMVTLDQICALSDKVVQPLACGLFSPRGNCGDKAAVIACLLGRGLVDAVTSVQQCLVQGQDHSVDIVTCNGKPYIVDGWNGNATGCMKPDCSDVYGLTCSPNLVPPAAGTGGLKTE
jgi:hypothetical protein